MEPTAYDDWDTSLSVMYMGSAAQSHHDNEKDHDWGPQDHVSGPKYSEILAGKRMKRKREQQVPKACSACQKAKAKCSNERPCSRCTRMNLACVDKDPAALSPELMLKNPNVEAVDFQQPAAVVAANLVIHIQELNACTQQASRLPPAGKNCEQKQPNVWDLTTDQSLPADCLIIELDMPDWTVLTVGRGAQEFYRHSPFGSMVTQTFSSFVHPSDLPLLLKMEGSSCEVRLMHFSSQFSAAESSAGTGHFIPIASYLPLRVRLIPVHGDHRAILVTNRFTLVIEEQATRHRAAGGLEQMRVRLPKACGQWVWNPLKGDTPGDLRSARRASMVLSDPEVTALASEDLSWFRRVISSISSSTSYLRDRCVYTLTNRIYRYAFGTYVPYNSCLCACMQFLARCEDPALAFKLSETALSVHRLSRGIRRHLVIHTEKGIGSSGLPFSTTHISLRLAENFLQSPWRRVVHLCTNQLQAEAQPTPPSLTTSEEPTRFGLFVRACRHRAW